MNVFTMWKSTRMVVLAAVTAALYVVILLPFKFATLFPGFTEIRPGAAIPVVCSLLFGPAAAWGAAVGNLVGDVLGGMLTPGSIGGFIGNFCYGWLPFLIWRAFTRDEPRPTTPIHLAIYLFACAVSAAACAACIAPALYLMQVPVWKAITTTIFFNNTLMSGVFGLILLLLLYPSVKSLGLTYDQLVSAGQAPERDLEADEV